MTKSLATLLVVGLAAAALTPAQAFGWGCSRSFSGSGRFGGSFSHSGSTSGGWGGFSHSGSTSWTSPTGRTYSGSHSGSGSYGWGGASYHGSYSNSWGGSGSYSRSVNYNGGGCYYGYHGYSYPTYCGSTGGAFAAGAVTGAIVGAAAASAAQPTTTVVSPTYVYPAPGVYVAPSTTVVTTPATVVTPSGHLAIGTTVSALPVGFAPMNVNGTQYYQSGSTWYQMKVVGSSVEYVVVPAP